MLLMQILTGGVPFVIMAVCDWLKQDTLPPRTNALIVIATTAILAFVWALFSGQLIGNFYADFLLIVALSFGIMNTQELAPIRAWLQRILVSPFAMFASPRIATPGALRASKLGAGQTWMQHIDTDLSAQPTRPMPPQGGSVIASKPDAAPTQDATPGQGG